MLHLPPYLFWPRKGCVFDSFEADLGSSQAVMSARFPSSFSSFSLLIGFMLLRTQPTASQDRGDEERSSLWVDLHLGQPAVRRARGKWSFIKDWSAEPLTSVLVPTFNREKVLGIEEPACSVALI